MARQKTIITGAMIIALAIGLLLTFLPQQNNAQDATMKKDVIIVLEETIAKSGGLIILQIIEIEEDAFELTEQPQTVSTDAQVAVINIPVLKGREYTYRFQMPNNFSGTTNRFSVGTTTLPEEGGKAKLLYHHIDTNPSWSLSYSRRVASVVQPAAAHQKYDCNAQHDILVCDATSVLTGTIPE